jgi:hypothetical protein
LFFLLIGLNESTKNVSMICRGSRLFDFWIKGVHFISIRGYWFASPPPIAADSPDGGGPHAPARRTRPQKRAEWRWGMWPAPEDLQRKAGCCRLCVPNIQAPKLFGISKTALGVFAKYFHTVKAHEFCKKLKTPPIWRRFQEVVKRLN